jgi:L-alanine-DL-glutamate epimerase-like enolase superfamily enzyme
MPKILEVQAQPARYPMKSPFTTARRSTSVADNVLVTVRLDDGTIGYGEASPAEYVTGETSEAILAPLPEFSDALVGQDVRAWRRWSAALIEAGPTCRSALEMALLDAMTRSLGISLHTWFGGAQTSVVSDLTLTIGPTQEVAATAAEAYAAGFRSLKIKVGGPSREEDLERVRAIAAAAPGVRLRLDANQAFTPDGALTFLSECSRHSIPVELIEQPVPADDFEALAAVTAWSSVPVIADEAIVKPSDAIRLATTGAAHGINIKVAKAGLLGALQIIGIAQASGLKLMLGCMMESLLGIGASLHLACGTGAFDYLDLDSHSLIGLKAEGRPFTQAGDVMSVSEALPGIGWCPELLPD